MRSTKGAKGWVGHLGEFRKVPLVLFGETFVKNGPKLSKNGHFSEYLSNFRKKKIFVVGVI